MKQKMLSVTIAALIYLAASCAFSSDKPVVFVSILPQKFFVQQISGDKLQVEVMVKPGASPATYEPKPSQMRMLSESDIFFAIGVPFENSWLSRISGINRDMEIVHTDEGIEKIMMVDTEHDEPEGEEEHDHVHSGYDPHIWLSPALVKKQAATITESLAKHYPQLESFFKENYSEFAQEVERLDVDLKKILKGRDGMPFMVFHPSWGYFARDYGLKQVAIEVEGKKPKSSQLRALIDHAKENDIRFIFAQPQFSKKSAGVIAREINGEVIFIDPLALDWGANMREVATKIKKTTEKP